MKASEAVVAYNPRTDQIAVGSFGDANFRQRTRHLRMSVGAVFSETRTETDSTRAQAQALADFITAVVRDKVDTEAAMREFSRIEEFRDAMPPEILPPEYWPERRAQAATARV